MKPLASIALSGALAATLAIPLSAPCMQTPQDLPLTPTQFAHEEAIPSIDFTFDHRGVPVPHYTLTIQQNGQGRYHGEQVASATPSDPPAAPQPFDTNFAISRGTTAKIFALSAKLKRPIPPCASSAKNIASTGTKTLHYTAPDSLTASCTYDYSENKNVQQLTQILQAIAETMDQGRKLNFLHRYDRLGLDHAIVALAGEASSGQALELSTIASSLQSIADDPEVLQRVRTRAAALLSTIAVTQPSR